MIPVNPIPSMRLVGVRAHLGETPLRIPPRPASEWLEALYSGGVGELLTLCEDSEALEDAIADGLLDGGGLDKTLLDMLGAAAGRESGAALRLIAAARGSWARVHGDLVRGGARLDQLPLGAFLDAAYTTFTRNLDAEELARFDAQLLGPQAPSSSGRGRPAPSPVPTTAAPFVMTRTRTRTRPIQPRPDAPSAKPTTPPAEPASSGPDPTSERRAVTGWPAYEKASRPRPTTQRPRLR